MWPIKWHHSDSDFISVILQRLKITTVKITNKINRSTNTMPMPLNDHESHFCCLKPPIPCET